jgi:hypothetical protein
MDPLGKRSQSFPMQKLFTHLRQQLLEKPPLNNPIADNNQDLAEECRKALEQSYGCPIPLPKLFRQKPKLKF